jgi:chitodextrinase
VSCNGVANWNASTIYNPGDRVVSNGKLYQANIQIWNTPPEHCPACNYYTLVGTCGTGGGGGDTTAPSVPSGLNSPSQTTTSISLSWTASTDNAGGSGVAGYDVFRSGGLVGSPTATSFTDSGLASNTRFSYTVRARDNAGNASAQSTALSVSTKAQAGCSTTPSVPTGLASPSQTDTSISLSWTASNAGPNCTVQYQILRNGAQFLQTASTSATDTSLMASTSFSYSVRAINEFGASAQSPAISVSTKASSGGGGGNTCSASEWNSTGIFTGGMQATHKGFLWEAKWWNQGEEPKPSDSGAWKLVGFCGTPPGPAAGRVFVPYVDVTMGFNLTTSAARTGGRYTLAFIIDGGGCTAMWGGTPPTPLSSNLYVSDVASLRAAGGDVVVSFGGAAGTELGSSCGSVASLQAQYQAVITKYQLKRVDFDLEGGGLSNVTTRNQAIRNLQAANPGLQVSYTLPVLPTGMLPNAVAVVSDAIAQGVSISQVNVMAMDFGQSFDNNGDMQLSAIRSGWATMAQLQDLLPAASHAQIARMVGVTVMIGQNDNNAEVFKMSDIAGLVSQAKAQGIGMLSFWSATRDRPCANGQIGPPALGECSGVSQGALDFSAGFSAFSK